MLNLTHIINPVKVKETSDLFYAQPITFESMLRAREQAKNTEDIELFTTQYEEDKPIIPKGFNVLSNLDRSVLDVNTNLQQRKLPLIRDIIDKAYQESTGEYIIYTNADIGLMSYFYDFVNEKIMEGHDALVINRRRLKSSYESIDQLQEMYADMGYSHPGFDCFVFRRDLVKKMTMGDICVGVSFIGVALAHNLFALAENPLYVDDKHLTFHIGTQVLVPRSNAFYMPQHPVAPNIAVGLFEALWFYTKQISRDSFLR